MKTPYRGRDLFGRLRALPPFTLRPPGTPRFDPAHAPDRPDAFREWLVDRLPPEARSRFVRVMAEAHRLAKEGLADPPPPRSSWVRHFAIAWHHAHDMEVLLDTLGHPKRLAGVHDLTETAPGRRIKEQLVRSDPWWIRARFHIVDPWYRRWAEALPDDADVGIGYLNPHLAASFYNRGLDPSGPANASSAHLLSDHHFGCEERPVDLVEQAANWVAHQLPREHRGVHHRPLAPWSALESVLLEDPLARTSDLHGALARDIAPHMAALEQSGHLVPWHLVEDRQIAG